LGGGIVIPGPGNREFTDGSVRKLLEETSTEIETTIRAGRALVHYNSVGRYSSAGDSDSFKTLRSRRAGAVLSGIQSNDHVIGAIVLSTGSEAVNEVRSLSGE